MLHHVGLPKTDIDYIYSDGPVMNELAVRGDSRMCLFTGSQAVAEKLTLDLRGRVKLEDAGFDWKVLGPDVSEMDYVTWQADQDACAPPASHPLAPCAQPLATHGVCDVRARVQLAWSIHTHKPHMDMGRHNARVRVACV